MLPATSIAPRKTNVPVATVIGPAPSIMAEPINITKNQMAAIDVMIRPAHLSGLAIRYFWPFNIRGLFCQAGFMMQQVQQ
jgi:hypothetical protein